ncbi:unnamed protein product, partial [Musa hybrid cultivar]
MTWCCFCHTQAGLYRGADGGADRAAPPARRGGSAQAGPVRRRRPRPGGVRLGLRVPGLRQGPRPLHQW